MKRTKKGLDYYLKLRYAIQIMPIPEEEGGGYSACIPELGKWAFVGDGDTIEEALRNLEEVKRDYFEDYLKKGIEIPKPKGELKTNWKLLYRLDVFKTRNKKRIDIVARDFRHPTCERRAYFTFWGEDKKIIEALLHFINEYCAVFMKLANKSKEKDIWKTLCK